MAPRKEQRKPFFPKSDAAILLPKYGPPPTYPTSVWPIFDPDAVGKPIEPWPADEKETFYPPQTVDFAPAPIPERPACFSDRYLRAYLAENERLRACMYWYYTRDLLCEGEFLSGLQEKANLAQESTGWECVVIGILDVNHYVRLAAIGLPLAILPRGETICAHTVTQPPGSVFLLPNMMEDWRFKDSPYVESGGLRAYAGAPLRLQNESGDCIALGSLCVAARTDQKPLNKLQQQTLARLADWVVSDIVHCARARRQRDRRRMSELLSVAQRETDSAASEEPVLRALQAIYQEAVVTLQSCKAGHVQIEGSAPIPLADLADGLWEDTEYLDDFISRSNHKEPPSTRVVRVIAAPCEFISGPSLLVVASNDFRLVFDDIDTWFIQSCANILSQIWHKRLLTEVIRAKEKFLRGFSHNLRTPIHGILGSVELLAEELLSRKLPEVDATAVQSGDSTPYLDNIRSAGRDLISIVNSMITLNRWADIAMADRHYANHTAHDLETELLSEVNKATVGDRRYRASLFFLHDRPPHSSRFRADLGLVRDSLLPLVINAIQNTSNGVVAVTVSVKPESKELIADIEDTGCGIHPDYQQRIFEPYEKVAMHSVGAGLGLTLASKFAALLHGSVVLVSSEIGRASHFRAIFQEMECSHSTELPQHEPLAKRLKNLRSKYFTMRSDRDAVSLCDYFARFLDYHGFSPSSELSDDCFVILDSETDSENVQQLLSRVPPKQVVFNLVSLPEMIPSVTRSYSNLFHVCGPFSTSGMSLALEEANERLLDMATSGSSQPRDENAAPLSPPSLGAEPKTSTDEGTDVSDRLSQCAIGTPADVASTPSCQAELPAESGPILSILSAATPAKPATLLVDDNAVNLRIMQMYCKKRGLPYYCAADGIQAVEMFAKQQSLVASGDGATGIQLILMDLQMPRCDGFEATRRIRQLEKDNNWKESIIFIVTGQDSPTDRATADDVGAANYFVKPVAIKDLDEGVRQQFPKFQTG
ncbi:histidine kinase HHK3p [Purpureocillium lavendulum]|uniref:histidine kinase n=1 Tax=Purpureocillium lavendulum TaxID=1247861 RepID=A0AB34FK90_9HYPO|nr:histidine kinase HHK3p [Purpureocillium lavendulum]